MLIGCVVTFDRAVGVEVGVEETQHSWRTFQDTYRSRTDEGQGKGR